MTTWWLWNGFWCGWQGNWTVSLLLRGRLFNSVFYDCKSTYLFVLLQCRQSHCAITQWFTNWNVGSFSPLEPRTRDAGMLTNSSSTVALLLWSADQIWYAWIGWSKSRQYRWLQPPMLQCADRFPCQLSVPACNLLHPPLHLPSAIYPSFRSDAGNPHSDLLYWRRHMIVTAPAFCALLLPHSGFWV